MIIVPDLCFRINAIIPSCYQCLCASYSWDTLYLYKLFLGYSVHVQCACTSSICVLLLLGLFASLKLFIKSKTAICFYVYMRQWLWANSFITCTFIFSIGGKGLKDTLLYEWLLETLPNTSVPISSVRVPMHILTRIIELLVPERSFQFDLRWIGHQTSIQ